MPQLDFSFYISQITWLLITFGGFFCISKFLLLPRLEKTLKNREDIVETNTKFAKEIIEKAKKINEKCDEKIKNTQNEINENIANLLKKAREFNDEKINDLKKKMTIEENKNIIKINKELKKIEDDVNDNVVEIIVGILEKVYLVKTDKNQIKKFLNKE